MRKSHFNDEFLVLLGPIISRLFTCSNEEKRVLALVLSLWFTQRARVELNQHFFDEELKGGFKIEKDNEVLDLLRPSRSC